MICTKDTAEKCYTDKFPYCLSACLDGYTRNASGQCTSTTPPITTVTNPATCQNFTYPTAENVDVNTNSFVANTDTAANQFCTSK